VASTGSISAAFSIPFDLLRELVNAGRWIASGFTVTLGGFVHSFRSPDRLPASFPIYRELNALVVSWQGPGAVMSLQQTSRPLEQATIRSRVGRTSQPFTTAAFTVAVHSVESLMQ
jgi:hypothetical protein